MRRKQEILSPLTPLLSITLPGIVFKNELRGLSVSLIIFVVVDAGTPGRDDVTGAAVGSVTVDEIRNAKKNELFVMCKNEPFATKSYVKQSTSKQNRPEQIQQTGSVIAFPSG